MTEADQKTVARMLEHDGPRRVEWGASGLLFCRGSRVVASLRFPVESADRERYREPCRDWVARGVLPAGAAPMEASS